MSNVTFLEQYVKTTEAQMARIRKTMQGGASCGMQVNWQDPMVLMSGPMYWPMAGAMLFMDPRNYDFTQK